MTALIQLEPEIQISRKLTVMIIDDDEILSKNVYRVLLEREGYRVVVAKSGKVAIQLLSERRDPPDLILLDCSMPHMNGESFLREVKKVVPHILKTSKILGFTCFQPNSSSFQKIESMGFQCIEKPFDIDGILKIVADCLGDLPKRA